MRIRDEICGFCYGAPGDRHELREWICGCWICTKYSPFKTTKICPKCKKVSRPK